MKKSYLFGLLCIPLFSFGQISLNIHNFPTVHEAQRMSTASNQSEIDLGTGANYHWDYSHLTATSQSMDEYDDINGLGFLVMGQFGGFAPQKFRATYYLPNPDLPLQNLPSFLPIQISNLNEMYRLTDDSLSLVGSSVDFNGQGVPIRNTDIETFYHFPLEYGNQYTTYGSFKKDMNPVYDAKWNQQRTHKVSVDGWGKIKTPMGTFEALRIHHEITERDSLYITITSGFGNWFPFTLRRGIYEWRTNTAKNPVVRIKTIIVGGNETISSIEFRDDHVFVGTDELNDEAVSFYPNPVIDQLSVDSQTSFETYEIFSSEGKRVAQGIVNNAVIDCSSLESGIYVIQLNGKTKKIRAKFVKQ